MYTVSSLVAAHRIYMLLTLFIFSATLFTAGVFAQQPAKERKLFPSTKQGVSDELMIEYQGIVKKYRSPAKEWWKGFDALTKEDRSRLEAIFTQMSAEQQGKQVVAFRSPLPPVAQVVPTSNQLASWKNEKRYGLWIDDERVKNAALNDYKPEDFAHVFVSKLYPNATNYGKHAYQINLMTNEYYRRYYNEAIAQKENVIMFRGFTFQTKSR